MKKSKIIKEGTIAATRARLGLSQHKLAQHLGISRTSIAMAEATGRSLPSDALLKMARLEIKMMEIVPLAKDPVTKEKISRTHSAELCEKFTRRKTKCELRMRKLTHWQEEMHPRYEKLQAQFHMLETLLAQSSDSIDMDFTRRALQQERDRILKQMEKCNLVEQALVRNRIILLEAEANIYRTSIEQMENNQSNKLLSDQNFQSLVTD